MSNHTVGCARPGTSITDREYTVLLLIADGTSNQDIADELKDNINTVKGIVRRIYARLGARDRAHAVALAYHRGILLVPPRAA